MRKESEEQFLTKREFLKLGIATIGSLAIAGCIKKYDFVPSFEETSTLPPTPNPIPTEKTDPAPTITPAQTHTPTPTITPTETHTLAPLPDTTGPVVTEMSVSSSPADDDSMLMGKVSARVIDPSGIDTVTLYYHKAGRDFREAGRMKRSRDDGDIYIFNGGPFHGNKYDFRILAVDNLGNANCTVTALAACPGDVLWIP